MSVGLCFCGKHRIIPPYGPINTVRWLCSEHRAERIARKKRRNPKRMQQFMLTFSVRMAIRHGASPIRI
jgi:hypothetical protein